MPWGGPRPQGRGGGWGGRSIPGGGAVMLGRGTDWSPEGPVCPTEDFGSGSKQKATEKLHETDSKLALPLREITWHR